MFSKKGSDASPANAGKDKTPSPAGQKGKVKPNYTRPVGLGDSPAEFYKWFKEADKDKDGFVNGNEAVAFFSRSRLPQPTLAKVWALSDKQRRGVLDLEDFVTSMKLISLAQSGKPISTEAARNIHKEEGLAVPQLVGINISGSFEPAVTVKQSPSSTKKTLGVSTKVVPKMSVKSVNSLQDGLCKLYMKHLRPLEEKYSFPLFHSPCMKPQDFGAKPSVMMLGQYSVGKTSFIKYLLGEQYPSAVIGPEPTTDRFVVVSHSHIPKTTPGNALAVSADKPFGGLTKFGQKFLNKFAGAEMPAFLLEAIDMIDTPGVLSGEKQRLDRGYEFPDIVRWFGERSDLILLLFDPYKLDISDEFKRVIQSLQGFDDKVRIVLNKADQVDSQHLMKVYGALMWSLSRIFRSPEVPRVYTGNFQDKDYVYTEFADLMDRERGNLIEDLYNIPKTNAARKVSEFVKRVRSLKIHCLICSALRDSMPTMFGKESKQAKLVGRLEETFLKVQQKYDLAVGDFPALEPFREHLRSVKIDSFSKLTPDKVKLLDEIMEIEIPALMQRFGNPFA
jgi:EH domain-containing protein 1